MWSRELRQVERALLCRVETLTLLLWEDCSAVRSAVRCGAMRENTNAPHDGLASDESIRTRSIRPTRALP